MVRSCAAFNCTSQWKKGSDISFHIFPLKNPALLKKWVIATKRKNFVPTQLTSLCSKHFTPEDYEPHVYPNQVKKRLKHDAVPTKFEFPGHMQQSTPKKRRTINRNLSSASPQDKPPESILPAADDSTSGVQFSRDAHPQSSPTKSGAEASAIPQKPNSTTGEKKIPPTPTKLRLRRKIKVLQQRLKRRERKIKTMKDVITLLKEKVNAPVKLLEVLDDNFSGFPLELIVHSLKNKNEAKLEQEQNELDELSALLDLDSTFSPDEQITRQETLSLAKSEKSVDILRTSNKLKTLLEVNIFEQSNNLSNEAVKKVPSLSQAFKKDAKENKHKISEIHNGDTDSSDDEDHKYAADQKYSETGRSIKNLLKKQTSDKYTNSASWKTHKSLFAPSESASGAKLSKDVYTDPYFGIRIVTPLISSQVLKERMQGKIPVTFTRLQNHLTTLDKSKDWVLAGVIVSKLVKTSQKGNPYVCWTLSDLREGLQTVSVFLFGKAYKNLWKTSTHIVVAILNPTQLENRKSSNDIAALSVLNSDQVMIWGKSKDLGTCKARKKNGEPCAVFVNVNQCDFCIYHVKQEYRKFTGRSELQAPSGGSLTKLKNKVLGKNEVFYAGKSYTASLAKPTKKQKMKDQKRLFQLFQDVNGEVQVGHRKGSTTQVAKAAPSARVQLMKDAERLQKQTGSPATVTSLALGVNNGSKNSKISTEEKKLWKSFGIGSSESETESQTSCSVSKSHREEQVCLKSTHENENENKTIISNRTVGNKKIACQQIFNIEGTKLSKSKSKNPTKNRFENLTKMKSIQCKTDESKLHSDIAKNQTFKGSVALQSQPNVDVCFEFEDYVKKNTLTALQLENSTIMSKNTHNAHSVRIPKLLKFTPPSHTRQTKTEKTGTSSVKKLLPMFIADVEKSPTLQKSLIDNNNERLLKPSVIKSKHITDQKDLTLEAPTPRLLYQKTPILSELGRTSSSIPARQSTAKLKALRYVQQKGPILKGSEKECKRKRSNFEDEINAICETSALSNRFIELMNVTSKHTDLISNAENQALEDYYDKMEKKEKMEEKMMTTYKIDCKAVRCLKCNYKWFSASEKCKEENHPIKVITAVKRFFQCQNCKNRTVTLEIIPLHNCTNCGRGNWIRAPMMRERTTSNVHLSIRGGEQKFSNSVVTDTNLDLLVPDDM